MILGETTGLKPLKGFSLKGVFISFPRRPIWKSGKQEEACVSQGFPDFLLSR
jgi:hypothetical protein